jgi:hypothetical protein
MCSVLKGIVFSVHTVDELFLHETFALFPCHLSNKVHQNAKNVWHGIGKSFFSVDYKNENRSEKILPI